jgi:hypothetical protein
MAVDDNLDNCMDFKYNSNIENTLLMQMPWNTMDTSFKRITEIKELITLL